MKPSELKAGYWVCTNQWFLRCYQTIKEAQEHIKYQKETMSNKSEFHIIYIGNIKTIQ